ncbi:MAG: PIN domain-containing protein [Candidatus Ranarchaeia archaeon]
MPPLFNVIRVLPDTNILVEIAHGHLTLLSELSRVLTVPYVVEIHPAVKNELKRLIKLATPKKAKLYQLALKVAKEFKSLSEPIMDKEDQACYADESLLDIAVKDKGSDRCLTVIVTNDKRLHHELRRHGCPVLVLRQRNHLFIDGHIPD